MLLVSTAYSVRLRTATVSVCAIQATGIVIRTLQLISRTEDVFRTLLEYAQLQDRLSRIVFLMTLCTTAVTGIAFRTAVLLIRAAHRIGLRTARILFLPDTAAGVSIRTLLGIPTTRTYDVQDGEF